MQTLLLIMNILLAAISLVTLCNVVTGPMLRKYPELHKCPFVSLLIPARNEEKNIINCLTGLVEQDYPNMEILVLDDGSDDDTVKIVNEFIKSGANDKIRLFHGKPLPQGWTGKNWACHQLSELARGQILIFTDADNSYSPYAVTATVAWMHEQKLGMLSAFPRQITHTIAEKLVVPVMDLFVYSLLPLWLTLKSPYPSLAAANGQWLAFTRDTYTSLGGHAGVRNEIVEDTFMARKAKKNGHAILTLSGYGIVSGQMYEGWRQVFYGFSKNAFGLWEYHLPGFILFLLGLIYVFILPFILLFIIPQFTVFVAVALNLLIRLLTVVKFKLPIVPSVILHPLAILFVLFISINSVISYYKGSTCWKGRTIEFKK